MFTGAVFQSRSPYGERGLKLNELVKALNSDESLSLRRAWIEMFPHPASGKTIVVALLTESVD